MLRERVGDLTDVADPRAVAAARSARSRSGRRAEGRERDSRHARSDAESHRAARSRGDRRASRPTPARARRTSRFSRARSACRRSSGLRDATSRLTRARDARFSTARHGHARDQSDRRGDQPRTASAAARGRLTQELELLRRAGVDHARRRAVIAARQRRPSRGGGGRGAQRRRGVGLMRTEFLVVGRATMPDEEEQYPRVQARRRGVRRHAGGHSHVRHRRRQASGRRLSRPRRIRFSAGARSACVSTSRSCSRCSCARCLRAAAHGDVRIMLPLVVTIDEVRQARALLDEALGRARRRAASALQRHSARRHDRDARRRRRRATRFVERRRRSSASARTISCSTRSPSIAATRIWRRASRRCTRPCCG